MDTNKLQPVETLATIESTLPVSLQKYSPTTIKDTLGNVRTVTDALKASEPTLKQLAGNDNKDLKHVAKLIKFHIIALDVFLKQKVGLSVEDIELVTDEIIEKYGCALTFADIVVVFRKAKLGEYGDLYEHLSAAKIIKWFDVYFEERCNTAFLMHQQEDKQKYGIRSGKSDSEILAGLGYAIDKEGKIAFNDEQVKKNSEYREELRRRMPRIADIDEEAYKQYKKRLIDSNYQLK